MNPQPKPIKRSTAKRKKHAVKHANIADVRAIVSDRDVDRCRVGSLLGQFGFNPSPFSNQRCELAHIDARGMGGNPDLSRDTPENTLLLRVGVHQGRRSHHSGHLRIRPLTTLGANGPCCFEFYEKLPKEIKSDDSSY